MSVPNSPTILVEWRKYIQMSSNVSYPYVPTLWRDHSGLFGIRWTLNNTNAIILSAMMGFLIAPTVGHVLSLLVLLLYVFHFQSRTRRYFQDQFNTVAINCSSPLDLIIRYFVLIQAYGRRLRILRSTICWTFLLVASLLLLSQRASIFGIGMLVYDGPVPITTRTCGYPNIAINVDNSSKLTLVSSHLVPLYGKAASRFADECYQSKDQITCKGPVGANFSWNVAEVPSKCCSDWPIASKVRALFLKMLLYLSSTLAQRDSLHWS